MPIYFPLVHYLDRSMDSAHPEAINHEPLPFQPSCLDSTTYVVLSRQDWSPGEYPSPIPFLLYLLFQVHFFVGFLLVICCHWEAYNGMLTLCIVALSYRSSLHASSSFLSRVDSKWAHGLSILFSPLKLTNSKGS